MLDSCRNQANASLPEVPITKDQRCMVDGHVVHVCGHNFINGRVPQLTSCQDHGACGSDYRFRIMSTPCLECPIGYENCPIVLGRLKNWVLTLIPSSTLSFQLGAPSRYSRKEYVFTSYNGYRGLVPVRGNFLERNTRGNTWCVHWLMHYRLILDVSLAIVDDLECISFPHMGDLGETWPLVIVVVLMLGNRSLWLGFREAMDRRQHSRYAKDTRIHINRGCHLSKHGVLTKSRTSSSRFTRHFPRKCSV
ncbi:hypothetical protein VNO77_34627 [Canavalia gladiata]|uniref:Uncharacterized protein n=1 Tax=Canavalia gladiata TaxID=3824 RepID=A0AAN9KDW8_CANGL